METRNFPTQENPGNPGKRDRSRMGPQPEPNPRKTTPKSREKREVPSHLWRGPRPFPPKKIQEFWESNSHSWCIPHRIWQHPLSRTIFPLFSPKTSLFGSTMGKLDFPVVGLPREGERKHWENKGKPGFIPMGYPKYRFILNGIS